ncbi:MAG TPA: dipicolinate synthase subunit B [Candidatus Acutalibacter pullicola]|uniref:Dipicolinate synthase subunit B n=1 Tax=Candidatus Acutalibacter pullicola TaxID=2838417 RepID=A0A9D2MUZ7_9FIRM|nr:dipicolinate synthase subunit B [Candidatus Acutalibacter pullicola]
MKTIGYALCGSFCTFDRALAQMETLAKTYEILPLMSQNAYATDTRFGPAQGWIDRVEKITGRQVIHTLVGAEPIGPKGMVDLLAVAPCTGNTLSKIASGITDTSVTMAVKSSLRIGIPVVLCCATNDAMAASGPNLLRLLNTKNVYVTPLRQDDPVKKPVSLVADFSLLPATIEQALQGKQLQPVFLPPQRPREES